MKESARPSRIDSDNARRAQYCSDIDMMVWARRDYGDDFAEYLMENCCSTDFMTRLVTEARVTLVDGPGGGGWRMRVSLANLDDGDYDALWIAIRSIMCQYYAAYVVCGRA